MSMRATAEAWHQPESWKAEALEKIREELKYPDSSYLEDLFFGTRLWGEKIQAAKERVPEELRKKATTFSIEIKLDRGEDVPLELQRYLQEVRQIKQAYATFIRKQSAEAILDIAHHEYDENLQRDPKWAKHLAHFFLDVTREKVASQVWVQQSIEILNDESTDILDRMEAAKTIVEERKQVRSSAEIFQQAIEFLIKHKEKDRYVTNVLSLGEITDLAENYSLSISPAIYFHFRPLVRREVEKDLPFHDRREKLREVGEHLAELNLLRPKEEDEDLFDILRGKTRYEVEFAEHQSRIDREMERLNLRQYEIKKETSIHLGRVAELLKEQKTLLDEGVRRNYYWELRRRIFDRNVWYEKAAGLDLPPSEWGKPRPKIEKWKTHRSAISFDLKQKPSLRLRFLYGLRNKQAYDRIRADEMNLGRNYLSVDDFMLLEIQLSFHSAGRANDDISLEDDRLPTLATEEISGSTVVDCLESILQPPEDISRAIKEFRRLAKEANLRSNEIRRIIQAMTEYATYQKHSPLTDYACYCEVGKCLTVPCDFQSFCRQKFELTVGTANYGDSKNFYHEVNIAGREPGKKFEDVIETGIVIDWTARQYPKLRDKPYPFVYRVRDAQKLLHFGPLQNQDFS